MIGTLGIVLRAATKAMIPAAVPVLRSLMHEGLRLDERVIRAALAQTTGEEWK